MYARLVSMYEYSTKERCRSVLLAEYFGQRDARACGKCDYCKATKKVTHIIDYRNLGI